MHHLKNNNCPRRARLTRLVSSSLVLIILTASFAGAARSQLGPAIASTPLLCMPTTEFSFATALITPSDQIRTGRIYFRSDSYPDFYYVELTRTGDHFQAVLPKPTWETQRVIFYFEAVDVSFNITTTPESEAEVVEDANACRRRDPKAAFYTGGNPSIIVGATSATAPPLPPGFAIEGIAQVISAAGAAGGIGAGTLTIAAAAAAVAAGVGVGALSPGETTTTEPPGPTNLPPGGTSTTTTVNVVVSAPPKACFGTIPNPPVIIEGQQITLDGRCSTPTGNLAYEWDLGDGRTRSEAFITPTYSVPGDYRVTLTVRKLSAPSERDSVSQTIRVESASEPPEPPQPPEPPVPSADLSLVKTASVPSVCPCQEFDYILTVTNFGPDTATGVTVVDCLPEELSQPVECEGPSENLAGCRDTLHPNCSGRAIVCNILGDLGPGGRTQVRLGLLGPDVFGRKPISITNTADVTAKESDPNPRNNEDSVTIGAYPGCSDITSLPSSFTSAVEIAPADGSATANVLMNRRQFQTMNNANPFRIRVEGRAGRNSVEAYLVSGTSGEGVWRFDFSGAEHFVPGSIEVARGDVVTRDAQRVVFRLTGKPGNRIEFTFLLEP